MAGRPHPRHPLPCRAFASNHPAFAHRPLLFMGVGVDFCSELCFMLYILFYKGALQSSIPFVSPHGSVPFAAQCVLPCASQNHATHCCECCGN